MEEELQPQPRFPASCDPTKNMTMTAVAREEAAESEVAASAAADPKEDGVHQTYRQKPKGSSRE